MSDTRGRRSRRAGQEQEGKEDGASVSAYAHVTTAGADVLALFDQAAIAYEEYAASIAHLPRCCQRRLLARYRAELVAHLRARWASADRRLATQEAGPAR